MISARGILAIAVGLFFIAFAIAPAFLVDEAPPWLIKLILLAVGAGLLVIGVVSLRFVWHRHHLRRTARAIRASVCVLPATDQDASMYTMHVRLPGRVWQIGIVIDANARPFADGRIRSGEAWLDPKTKTPLAVAIEGRQMNTLPVPSRIAPDAFGRPEP